MWLLLLLLLHTTDSTLQDPLASGNGLRTSKVEDERGDSLRKPSYQKDNPQRLTNYDPLVFRPLTISTNTNKRRNEAGRHKENMKNRMYCILKYN